MKTHHKIIIGDSRWMKEVPDESVHLIITSPPYRQLKDYGNGKKFGFRRIFTVLPKLNYHLSRCILQRLYYFLSSYLFYYRGG